MKKSHEKWLKPCLHLEARLFIFIWMKIYYTVTDIWVFMADKYIYQYRHFSFSTLFHYNFKVKCHHHQQNSMRKSSCAAVFSVVVVVMWELLFGEFYWTECWAACVCSSVCVSSGLLLEAAAALISGSLTSCDLCPTSHYHLTSVWTLVIIASFMSFQTSPHSFLYVPCG